MIEEVKLITVLASKGRKEDPDSEVSLWPFNMENSVIKPHAGIYGYRFRLKVKNDIFSVSLKVNNIESIDLFYVKMEKNVYVYESKLLKYKSFLGFNLGVSDFELYINNESFRLRSIKSTQSLLPENRLEYMYGCVSESEFFNLYILNYSRGNLLASEKEDNSSSFNFWLSISIARNILLEVQRFFKGELEFTSRVEKESVVIMYGTNSMISGDDIEWLIQNPNELKLSSTGNVLVDGVFYDIENISQSKMAVNYNTYENRLLLSCLYSIKISFFELMKEYKGNKRFPHKSLDAFIDVVSDSILKINKKLKLYPPFNEIPGFSNKYLGDARYINIYSLIIRWYATNTLTYGDDIRAPILGVTEIFEHYCFIKIADCLKNNGFKLDGSNYLSNDEVSYVSLARGDEVVSIYYEPSVSYKGELPIINSKNMNNPYKPDFVITFENGDHFRCGVIDAKFSDIKTVKNLLAKDIYLKYGLYFHKENHEPIDYVYAMYPSLNNQCDVTHERRDDLYNIIKPSLGYFSIPFSHESSDEISSFLINLIIGNSSDYNKVVDFPIKTR